MYKVKVHTNGRRLDPMLEAKLVNYGFTKTSFTEYELADEVEGPEGVMFYQKNLNSNSTINVVGYPTINI